MYYTTEAIASDEELASSTTLITDGRFSGATRGPAIGLVSPEDSEGGSIALIEDGDLIKINIDKRELSVVGIRGEERTAKEIDKILANRARDWTKPEPRFTKG